MRKFKKILKCIITFLLFLHDSKSGKPGNTPNGYEED